MPKALKRTLQVLLVISLTLGAVGGAIWLGDTIHERTYINKEIPDYDPTKPIPAEALREDFSIIRGAIENEHSAPYLYTSKEELSTMFDAAYTKLDEPMSEIGFVKLVGSIIHAVHDGHTNLLLPRDYYRYMYRENTRIFPAMSLFTKNEVYVWSDGTLNNSLPRGSKITAIDGESVQTLVQQVTDLFVSTDGYTYSAARQILGAKEDIRARFMTYLAYLKGFPETYEVTFQTPRGEERTVQVTSISLSELTDTIRERYSSPDVPGGEPVNLRWEDGVPVLSVTSFNNGSFDEYAEILERTFTEIHERNVPNLIIDLRDNGGGSPERGWLLLRYFGKADLTTYDSYEVRTLQSAYSKYALSPWSNRAEYWFYQTFLMQFDKERNIWIGGDSLTTDAYNFNNMPSLRFPKITLPPFKGQVFLLVSGYTFSAGSEFAAFARAYLDTVTIIGQETSGSASEFVAGQSWELILPNTRLNVRVPLAKFDLVGSEALEKGRGVIPDVEVWPTFEDVVEGRDKVLETALDLISEEGSSETNQTRR